MEHWKAKGLDFSRLFNKPEAKPGTNITASAVGASVSAPEGRHVDRADASSQRSGETELVSIGVGQVEEPRAPFGVARHCVWAVAGRDHARMEVVNVGMVEDHASPPGPLALGRLRDQIEIAPSRSKARECCVVATVNNLKSQPCGRSGRPAPYRG